MKNVTVTTTRTATQSKGQPWRGLGDVIASATKAVGIKPCGGCKKRQATLNRWVPFNLPGNPAEHGVPRTNTGPAAAGNGALSTTKE